MNIEDFIGIVARFLLSFELAYYLITLLQWYNYSFYRIIFMHHKFMWHIWFFLLPLVLSIALQILELKEYVMVVAVLLLIALVLWRLKQDKPLKVTKRVQRFFVLCFIFVLLDEGLGILFDIFDSVECKGNKNKQEKGSKSYNDNGKKLRVLL